MTVHKKNHVLRCAALLSLMISSIAGCTQRQSLDSLVSEAAAYQRSGNKNAAIIQLKNALAQDPRNAEVRRQLATIYLQTGDGASAEKEIRKAIEGGIAADTVWPTLAKSLLLQGKFQNVLDEAPAAAGGDLQALGLRGDAYLSLGKNNDALRSYEEALKLDSNAPAALAGRARLHAMQGNSAAAQTDLDKALASDGKNVDVWLLKGQLLQVEGKLQEALSAYSRVIDIDPNSTEGKMRRANVEIALEKYDDAQKDIDAIFKQAQNSLVAYHSQALLYHKQGKQKEALETVQQVLRAAPDHPPSLLLAGVVQKELGAFQQAEDYLQRYLEKDPRNLLVQKQFASVLLRNGELQRAAAVVETGLKSAPNDVQLLALAGDIKMQEKSYSSAASYFEKAARAAPDAAKIQTALGMSKMAQGDNAAAMDSLEKALQLDDKSIDTGLLLVNSKITAKQYDAALALLRKLERDHPANAAVPNLAGVVHLRRNDEKMARTSFEKALSLQPSFIAAAANLARLDVKDNKHDAAQQRFLSILEKDPSNVLAMMALAELANGQEKSADALAWLEKANRAEPKNVAAAAVLAQQYRNTGKNDKALSLAKAFALENPESRPALELLARMQLGSNDANGALETLARLAKLSPNPAAVHVRIGVLQMSRRDFTAAQDAVNKALAIDPKFADARYLDGVLKIGKGDAVAAQAIAKSLQSDHPRSAQGHVLEAETWMAKKDPVAATASLETAFKLQPDSEVLARLHRALESAGKVKEAQTRANAWLATHANDRRIRMLVAESNFTRGQYKAAITHYEALLQRDPKNFVALNNLAIAYHAVQDGRALDTAEKAHKIVGDNAAVLDTLGWILFQRGDRDRGLPLLRKASGMAPDSREIKAHLEQAERDPAAPKAREDVPEPARSKSL